MGRLLGSSLKRAIDVSNFEIVRIEGLLQKHNSVEALMFRS